MAEEQGSEVARSEVPDRVKEMRRIAAKTEPPTDKNQLISYLSDRITQAEDALADTEQLLQSEVKERKSISGQIQQRNSQLEKLYEVDQRALPEKIRERLTDILTTTINQKVEAEEKLGEQKNRNYQFKQMYGELKWEEKNITQKLDELKEKEEKFNAEITALEEENQKHEDELKEQSDSFLEFKEKKESLENKYLQMKVAVDRMADIKGVLNRFFGNEDLFDEKMDLKEQSVRRVEVISRESQNRQPPRELKTQSKLKPLNYTSSKNEDEDFWRGEYKGRS